MALCAFGKGSASSRRVKATAGPRTSSACRTRGCSSPKARERGLRPEREHARAAGVEPGRARRAASSAPRARRSPPAPPRRRRGRPRGRPAAGCRARLRGAVAPIRRPVASSACSPGSPPGKAWPISKSARSAKPRAWLRAAARSRPGQQVRAQVAHLRADRVLQPHRLAAAAEERGRRAVDEAVGHALVEAERGDPPPRLALAALHRRQDRPRDPGGRASSGLPSSPVSEATRAISSTRSASPCTSGRQDGTRHLERAPRRAARSRARSGCAPARPRGSPCRRAAPPGRDRSR